MTVKELITYLQTLDGNMPIIERRYSDYGPMEFERWEVIEAVRMSNGDWYMKNSWRLKQIHTQGELVQCLLFEGN
jgi:hypothetical protein